MEKKQRILVIDNDLHFIHTIQKYFAVDYTVKTASTESEALSGVGEFAPDLIFISLSAPEFDGFSICRQLKNRRASSNTPIIFVSDHVQLDEKMKCFMSGGIDYLIKPVEQSEINLRIKTHLELKNAHESVQLYNQKLKELLEERTRDLIRSERQSAICLMIQGIIHNLRNPMVGILGHAEFIRTSAGAFTKTLERGERPNSNECIRVMDGLIADADSVITAANLLNRMIDSLMVKSRSDKRTEIESIDLNELLMNELEFLTADLKFKHFINKEIHLSPNPLWVNVVVSEISQVFQNILRNAIQALWQKKSAAIVIESGGDDSRVWFSVADNGVGISHKIIDRIFDPFFTTKPAPCGVDSLRPHGTGLGLYSCLEILKSYRGEIKVASEEGQGATFTVFLPHASDELSHPAVIGADALVTTAHSE